MIKIIATGYSDTSSCEEIFLDDSLNIVNRYIIPGVSNASFVALKSADRYFVSKESDKSGKIYEVNNRKIINELSLDTCGIVYLSFLEKSGIIISGSYSNGDVFSNKELKMKFSSVHCIVPDSSERFLYITDIKKDRIFVYDLIKDELVDEVTLPDKTGPRHLKFYKDFLYLVTEYSNEIFVFSHNSYNGKLKFLYKYSSFFENMDSKNFAAAIDIANDVLAVSNRGNNVISCFSVFSDGSLDKLYEFDCLGDWPRDIKFFNDYLVVANERSNEICIFNTKDKNGKLVSRIKKDGVNFICLEEGDF